MSERLFAFLLAACTVGAVACAGEKEPVVEGVEREELGTFTTDTGGGITFEVEPPPDAVSSLVYCGPYGDEFVATAETITGPSGNLWYDMEDPEATAMRVDNHSDLLPILLPISPDLDIADGAYTYRVYFDADRAMTATCTGVYRVDGVNDRVKVDLELVFVGVDGIAPGLNAAQGEDVMGPVLDVVAAAWSGAGLEIGDVTYRDFDGDVDAFTIVDDDEELGQLLRTVEGDTRSITYFFVQEITSDGVTILGLAGGPPGVTATGGTSKSGVVVTAASFSSDPEEVGRIMAHEGGHFMGLFHTTEKDGTQHDRLSDTPECSTDTSGDGVFATNECEGTGAENLMFWTGANTDMSADQGWVLARSAATR